MRIAITGPYFYPQNFGIEKVMYAHAKYLALGGHEVTVIASKLRYPDGVFEDVPDFEARDGFRIIRLPTFLRSLGRYISYPSNGGIWIPGMIKTLETLAPNLVHAHNVGAAAWAHTAALYCSRADKGFYYSLYHHPSILKLDTVRKAPLRLLNRLPMKIAKSVFLQTENDRQHVLHDYNVLASKKLQVLANGVDPATAPRREGQADHVNFLFVGRVDDQRKGFDVLESAIAGLAEPYRSRFVLRVVGTVSEERKERLLRRLGPHVVISGNIPENELELAYAAADIFVMPSYYEGFGMPFIEAMRYGVAVIGTKVGGIPEVVPESVGILVPPGDAAALRDAMERMMREGSFASFGACGKIWVKRFEWRKVIDQLELYYQTSLDIGRSE